MKIFIQLLLVGFCFIYFDMSSALQPDGSSIPTQTSLPTDVAVLPVLGIALASTCELSRVTQVNGAPHGYKELAVGTAFLPPGPRPDTGRG